MDELFDFSLSEIDAEVENIAKEANVLRESAPEQSREIIENGLKKYPENDVLLTSLLYVINYSEKPDETIKIANKVNPRMERKNFIRGFFYMSRSPTEYQVPPQKWFRKYH